MRVYKYLSKIPLTRDNYALKFFLVALPGMLLPCIMLVCLLINKGYPTNVMMTAGIIVLLTTFMLIYFTWRAFQQLAQPVGLALSAISGYNTANRELPSLPVEFQDEVGLLLKELQEFIDYIDLQLTEKSDMIDLLSHDLRSPVARIHGLGNLIKLDENPENVEYAEYIINECKNMTTLLENILLMFKEDSNAFEAQIVNLKSLVVDSVNFFQIAANDKQLTLSVDISDDLYINVQQGLFTQAVRNILGNAIKFSKEGKSIFITAKRDAQEVIITIRDEGVGMKHEDLAKIFERFTSAGKKGTKGEASFGLGLYLSKKIIEKQGGKIVAESGGVNKGAQFVITLYQLITKKRKDIQAVKKAA